METSRAAITLQTRFLCLLRQAFHVLPDSATLSTPHLAQSLILILYLSALPGHLRYSFVGPKEKLKKGELWDIRDQEREIGKKHFLSVKLISYFFSYSHLLFQAEASVEVNSSHSLEHLWILTFGGSWESWEPTTQWMEFWTCSRKEHHADRCLQMLSLCKASAPMRLLEVRPEGTGRLGEEPWPTVNG